MSLQKYLTLKNYKLYFKYHLNKKHKVSYSQCGEDILMSCALTELGILKPTYLDIGTNHPILNNNTYLFYSRGARGICVEPDSELFRVIKRIRKYDTCLNAGIGPVDDENAVFYVMSSKPLGTFLQSEANKYVNDRNYGKQEIRKVTKMPLVSINTVMAKYFSPCAEIVSVDAEGYDLEIIASLDLQKYRPKVMCVETLRYGNNGKVEKQNEIIKYLTERGYFLYADTYVNSIFVDKTIWKLKRKN